MECLSFDSLIEKPLLEVLPSLARDLPLNLGLIQKDIEAAKEHSSKDQYFGLSDVCQGKTGVDPSWGLLAGRILMHDIKRQVPSTFSQTVKKTRSMCHDGFYSFVMANKDTLDSLICGEKDWTYDFFSVRTLLRSYLGRLKKEGESRLVETPQYMFLRVAGFLAYPNLKRVEEIYKDLSEGNYIHASPTLFNAGLYRPQLASCFLMGVLDDLDSITKTWKDVAFISKNSGGIGYDITSLRHSEIGKQWFTNNGIVPWIRILDTILCCIDQGGRRKGSGCMYIQPWHIDIEEYLDLRKGSGPEDMRARNLFYALWVPDLFMKRVKNDEMWSLFCPNKARGLEDKWGLEFEMAYQGFESKAKAGKINRRQIKARDLWRKILLTQIETGVPYMLFSDACNRKSNQKNLGTIRCSNLCVSGKTFVLTKEGHIPISSLEDQTVEVWNGNEWSTVTIRKTGENQDLLKVKFSNGVSIECTPYHKFYLQKAYHTKTPIEVEAKDLPDGAKLIKWDLPIINYSKPEPFHQPYTHGFFCGDGTTYFNYSGTKRYPKVSLYGDEKKKLLAHLKYESASNGSVQNRIDVVLCKSLLPKFTVPIRSDLKTRLRWFEGYSDADGTISRNGTNESLQISSIRKDFLLEVRLLLQTLGVEVKITKNKDARKEFLPDGKGGTKEYECKKIWRLLLNSNDLYHLSQLGFSPKRLSFTPRKPQRQSSRFVKVVKVKEGSKGVDTFCFTEPKRHRGMFNGILTGQCAEIVEYTNPKTDIASCNLASLCLSSCVVKGIQKTPNRMLSVTNEDQKKIQKVLNEVLPDISLDKMIWNNPVAIWATFNCFDVSPPKWWTLRYGEFSIQGMEVSYFDFNKLERLTAALVRNLNAVIDRNYYPPEVPLIKECNLRHRPIGIGVQGLADTFALLDLTWESPEARQLNHDIFETIYYAAVKESIALAKEHGPYESFEDSPASRGLFQFDLWEQEAQEKHLQRKAQVDIEDFSNSRPKTPDSRYDWDSLRKDMTKCGLRNSLLIALMPTASTATITGNNECFEPFTDMIFTRRVLAGQFMVVNKHLVHDLKEIGMWDSQTTRNIIQNKGSAQGLVSRDPKHADRLEFLKKKYKTVFELPQKTLLQLALDRGRFVCQSQSFNCWMANPTFKKLNAYHFFAWEHGAKTGMYYLRQKAKFDPIDFTDEGKIRENNKECDDEVCLACQS